MQKPRRNKGVTRKLTPRQKCALAFPVETARDYHLRYHRINGIFESILTFDLHRAPEDFEPDRIERTSGRVGVWHGRVARKDCADYSVWTPEEKQKADTLAHRLVHGVGQEAAMLRESKDGSGVQIFRWATTSEVAQAIRAKEGTNK